MTPGDQIISLLSSPLSHLILPRTKRSVLFIKGLRYLCYVNCTTLNKYFLDSPVVVSVLLCKSFARSGREEGGLFEQPKGVAGDNVTHL